MKGLSVRTKITLYFSAVLLVVVASTFLVILTVGSTVLRQVVGDNLIALVEDNLGEVEYVRTLPPTPDEHEQAIRYGDGWLVVDYDFLDEVNGVTAALYAGNGSLLYGSNPVGALPSAVALSDGQFQTVDSRGRPISFTTACSPSRCRAVCGCAGRCPSIRRTTSSPRWRAFRWSLCRCCWFLRCSADTGSPAGPCVLSRPSPPRLRKSAAAAT